MSDAAPPAWVKRLEHLNDRGQSDSGAWRVHVGLWGWGPFRKADNAPLVTAPTFYASAATIADKLGMKKAAVAKQLRKLALTGWVKRDEKGRIVLAAWGRPGVFELDGAKVGGTWADPTLPAQDPTPTAQGQGVPQDPDPTGPDPLTAQDPTPTAQGQGVTPCGYHSSSSCSSSSELDITSGKPAHAAKVVTRATRAPAPVRELDPFEARLREVSEAAFMRWSPDDASPHSFSHGLRQFIAENSEADALTVLRAWEAARSSSSMRPSLGVLWYSGGRQGRPVEKFRAKALGREEVGTVHAASALSDKGVDAMGELQAMRARRAAAKAAAS